MIYFRPWDPDYRLRVEFRSNLSESELNWLDMSQKPVWSEWGIALTGYVVPGCVEDGTWMLWENSSVVVAVVVLARYFLDNFLKKSSFLVIFYQKLTFCDIFLKVVFSPKNFRRRHVPPSFSACFDRGPFNHPSDRGPFNHPSDRGPFNNISHINIYIYIY